MERYCPRCEDWVELDGGYTVRLETYTTRGIPITVPVLALVCPDCDERIGSDEEDQAILDHVHALANNR